MTDPATEVVREAERTIYRAKWRVMEEGALRLLAGTHGLAYLPVFPGHEVVQVVTYNGRHVGHIRRESAPGPYDRWVATPEARWVAIPKRGGLPIRVFGNAYAAAEALVPARRRRVGTYRPERS